MKQDRLINIDALRGVAVLLVIFLHVGALTPNIEKMGYFYHFVMRSAVGMQLFFVLSGYLIAKSFNNITSAKKFSIFLIRRVARIYPLYFIMIHLYLLLYLIQSSNSEFVPLANSINVDNLNILNYLIHIFLMQGFVPNWQHTIVDGSWSIVNEAYFYLLFPIIISKTSYDIKKMVNFLMLTIVVASLFAYFARGYDGYFGYHGFLSQLPCFIIGVLVYIFELRQEKAFTYKNSEVASLVILFALLLILGLKGDISPLGYHVVSALFFGFILYLLINGGFVFGRLFFILHDFGKMSYSLFFSHLILLKAFHYSIVEYFNREDFLAIFLTNAFIGFVGAWIFSKIIFYPIEKYFIKKTNIYVNKNFTNDF